MLEEFRERIENAKTKQYRLLERFHVGDAVYPFWLKNFIVYGIVIDIDTVARKVICDFNGVRRQFCPEDLMLVNPDLARRDTLGITASTTDNDEYKYYVVLDSGKIESGWEYKEDAEDRHEALTEDGVHSKVVARRTLKGIERDDSSWHAGPVRTASAKETHLSPDTDNGIRARCKECGGEIAVSYDEQTACSDFVCTNCGKRISENDLSKKTKKAMRMQLAARQDKKDEELYDTEAPEGELDKPSYTHYVVLDRNGAIESGHSSLDKATKRMDELADDGVPCHVVRREDLRLRPTDDTHWFRGIVAGNRRLANELVAIAKMLEDMD